MINIKLNFSVHIIFAILDVIKTDFPETYKTFIHPDVFTFIHYPFYRLGQMNRNILFVFFFTKYPCFQNQYVQQYLLDNSCGCGEIYSSLQTSSLQVKQHVLISVFLIQKQKIFYKMSISVSVHCKKEVKTYSFNLKCLVSFREVQGKPSRVLFYILPAVFGAIIINITKFFEVEFKEHCEDFTHCGCEKIFR